MIRSKISELTTEPFSGLSDPRADNARHLLNEIFFISLCAVICGAESWQDIELYGKSKHTWLKEFLRLPHGIPSDDTYRRVFSAINPDEFESCFRTWVQNLLGHFGLDVICVDGKTLRRSFDSASSQSAVHMVSAWSAAHQLVLGQVKVESKSNEIRAIPELLRLLDISGNIITVDAMGTQKEIARQVVDQGGDYILALKKITKLFTRRLNVISGKIQTISDRILNFFMKRLTADTDVSRPAVIISLPISKRYRAVPYGRD